MLSFGKLQKVELPLERTVLTVRMSSTVSVTVYTDERRTRRIFHSHQTYRTGTGPYQLTNTGN